MQRKAGIAVGGLAVLVIAGIAGCGKGAPSGSASPAASSSAPSSPASTATTASPSSAPTTAAPPRQAVAPATPREAETAPASSTPAAVPPATSAPAPPATTGCYPETSGGNCYEPGEYCRDDDHGMTGVAGDGESITCENDNGWRWEPS